MILYLDASSLAKNYVAEQGSSSVGSWIRDSDLVATSVLAFVEIHSALARRLHDGSLAAPDHQVARESFLRDWESLVQVEPDEKAAAALATRHRLRALDAVHLAAAMTMASDEALAFSSFDVRLNAAASSEGLKVLTAS